jgi:hypothetical protein
MRRIAMRSALSARLAESALTVVDDLALTAAKTREVRGVMTALGVARSALIVIAEADEAMTRASRNLPEVRAVTPGGLNLLDVLKYRHLILTRAAVEALTEQLLKKISRGKADADDSDEAEATESGAAVPMEEAATAKVEAGAPADVAEADAAEEVASTNASDADSADEDGKGDA